jgi:RimJ/RimL family protein N-acetyltransferase
MPPALLDAFIAGDRAAARGLVDYRIPSGFPGADALALIRFRREQLSRQPERAPWLLRAMVLRETRAMVGYVNFHGPPGSNDIGARDAVELGWTVFPSHRRRGYATETARALMQWAATEHGIRRFISSTTPENAASLRVHEKLGFVRTGQIVDGEIIFELRR